MRVLVFGGRDFDDETRLRTWLDALNAANGFTVLIQGGAKGADRLAAEWARSRGLSVITVLAHWRRLGVGAGPERNQRMLDQYQPEFAVAFPGGRGTADMMRRCRVAGLSVICG